MADIKKQTSEDLTKLVNEKREALRDFRFSEAGSRTRNVKEGRTIRREIAQILTEIRARQIKDQKSAKAAAIASNAKNA